MTVVHQLKIRIANPAHRKRMRTARHCATSRGQRTRVASRIARLGCLVDRIIQFGARVVERTSLAVSGDGDKRNYRNSSACSESKCFGTKAHHGAAHKMIYAPKNERLLEIWQGPSRRSAKPARIAHHSPVGQQRYVASSGSRRRSAAKGPSRRLLERASAPRRPPTERRLQPSPVAAHRRPRRP
jgi:hypothetical protein